jgi:ribose transport system ATP-binding protein
VRGLTTSITSPADALLAGIALAPESRKEQGILGAFSISDTIALTPYRRGSSAPVSRSAHAESTTADRWISELQVNCLDREQSVSALSGGNQQKVILARCLESHPTVLLLDEPTRGIDIGARRAIYQLLFSLARQGLAILFVSSELDEVMGIADRALVMSEGRMMGELERKDFSEHAFMHLASPHREQPGQSAWAG